MTESKSVEMSFEEALSRLEYIVGQLESGSQSLENSLALFEEGTQLSKICSGKLAEAENRIEVLMKRGDGQLEWQPFTAPQRQ